MADEWLSTNKNMDGFMGRQSTTYDMIQYTMGPAATTSINKIGCRPNMNNNSHTSNRETPGGVLQPTIHLDAKHRGVLQPTTHLDSPSD